MDDSGYFEYQGKRRRDEIVEIISKYGMDESDLMTIECPVNCGWQGHLAPKAAFLNEDDFSSQDGGNFDYLVAVQATHLAESHPEIAAHIYAAWDIMHEEIHHKTEETGILHTSVTCPYLVCPWYRVVEQPKTKDEQKEIEKLTDAHFMDHMTGTVV